jgi:23S rRNA pseudouridine1911/1915/1917 synthase
MLDRADILFCDNHVLAVNKPAGLATQPSREHADNLEDRAKAWIKAEFAKPGNVFLHAVHRLDRPAAGIVVFARTDKALSRLNEAIRSHACRKEYLAVLEGRPPEGTLIDWLAHDDFRARLVAEGDPAGARCELSCSVVEERNGLCLARILLVTGRYHQIRAQMAARQCPIAGDGKYGAKLRLDDDARIALLHHRLTLPHPVRGEPQELTAPMPSQAPWDQFKLIEN